jgi:hypothetical protein
MMPKNYGKHKIFLRFSNITPERAICCRITTIAPNTLPKTLLIALNENENDRCRRRGHFGVARGRIYAISIKSAKTMHF